MEINSKDVDIVEPLVELYSFNRDYDFYLSYSVPQSEAKKGDWHTDIPPPEHIDGFIQTFNTDTQKWVQVEDNRGRFAYDIDTGAPVIVDYKGKLKDGFTFITPYIVDASFSNMA